MDPDKEIVFRGPNESQALLDRWQMPIFFVLGGEDDQYLADLMNISVGELYDLIYAKSANKNGKSNENSNENFYMNSNQIVGVYASRATLLDNTYARIFQLTDFLNFNWPILTDLTDPESFGVRAPTTIEMTWVIRALQRHDMNLSEKIRTRMLTQLYPEKLKLSINLTVDNLANVYNKLSNNQRNYPVYVIINDFPVKLNTTIGQMLSEISLTSCTKMDMDALKTSLQLISE